jgi:hypothetical protein
MNAVNARLGPWVALLRAQVEQLGLVSGWLASMELWAHQVIELECFIFANVPEPITESEHRRLRKTARPDRASRYEVYPDAKAADVESMRMRRNDVLDLIRSAPFASDIDGAEKSRMQEAAEALLDRLVRQIPDYWASLRCVEVLFDQAAAEFGEDAAIPELRATLDWLREQLTDLRQSLSNLRGRQVELPEPDEEQMETTRRIAYWPVTTAEPKVLSISLNDHPAGN